MSLSDITAIVTGGGSGIGAAIAETIVARGGKIVITGRRGELLAALKQKIDHQYGAGRVESCPGSVCDPDHVARLFELAHTAFGGVSCLVNNAAIINMQPFIEISMEDWDEVMEVNVRGAVLCSKQAFAAMKDTGGMILNIASLGGLQNTQKFKGLSAYSVSKFAIVGLTEVLAEEGREYGIRVNCIAPGAVETDMLRKAAPFLKTSTMPQDIANLAAGIIDSKTTGSIIAVHSNE